MIAWIRLDDSEIHYPVMHNKKNNEWYKTHDWQDEYSQAGSIYLDSFNDEKLGDKVSVMAGSGKFSERMFSDLVKWQDEKFFKEHRGGRVFIPAEEFVLEVVAALDLPQTSELLNAEKLSHMDAHEVMAQIKDKAKQYEECSYEKRNIFILKTFEGEVAHVVVVLGGKL